jgi:hypothetical protein
MIRHRSCRRLALRLVCAVGASATMGLTTAHGQSDIVDFNFIGNNGPNLSVPATTVATGLATPVNITSNNVTIQGRNNAFNASNWAQAPTGIDLTKYFTFTVTGTPGNFIDLHSGSLILNVEIDNQGPSQLVVRTSLDNFATNVGAPFTPTVNVATLDTVPFATYLTNIGATSPVSAIELRMYGYSATQTGSTMWFQSTSPSPLNAVRLTGTVTPTPEPTLVLSAAAAATGLAWLYRGIRRQK